jgi:hypothetical protein
MASGIRETGFRGPPGEWFGVHKATDRWRIMRASQHAQTAPGEFTQTLDYFGSEYVHTCAQPDCPQPRQFYVGSTIPERSGPDGPDQS